MRAPNYRVYAKAGNNFQERFEKRISCLRQTKINRTEERESSNESFTSSLQNQVSTFKETVAQEQFAANNESRGISIEENGRIVGSLFTHKAVDAVITNLAQKSSIADELRDLGIDSQYPIPRWLQTYPESSTIMPHPTTDLAFSTNYTATHAGEYDVNMLSYQARGNLALSSGYYSQAIQDFSSAITIDPNKKYNG